MDGWLRRWKREGWIPASAGMTAEVVMTEGRGVDDLFRGFLADGGLPFLNEGHYLFGEEFDGAHDIGVVEAGHRHQG